MNEVEKDFLRSHSSYILWAIYIFFNLDRGMQDELHLQGS